jgi:hypothetical protein
MKYKKSMNFKDIYNRLINKNDKVLVYIQKYRRKLIQENIYEVDQTKPYPVADVPMARGRVEWDLDFKDFVVRYDWVCDTWKHKSASQMEGGNYAYEIID